MSQNFRRVVGLVEPFACEMIFVSIAGPVYLSFSIFCKNMIKLRYKILEGFQRGANVDYGGFWPFTYLFVVFWTVLIGPITFYSTDNSASPKWWYINLFFMSTYFLTEIISKTMDNFSIFLKNIFLSNEL